MKKTKISGNKLTLILLVLCISIFFIGTSQVQAQVTFGNYTNLTENSASILEILKSTALEIESMETAGFNTTRVNDELLEAKQLFDVQLMLEHETNTSDYSIVTKKTDFITALADKAFEISDELIVLESRITESSGIIDITEPMAIYEQAKEEFGNERYTEALVFIEEAYRKVSDLEAEKTKTRAIITATRSLIERMRSAWKELLIAITAIIVATFLLYDRTFVYFIKRKLKRLELEKTIIKDLVKTVERDYFETKDLSETTYHIKMNKYGELVRDINRQIPLLREQLEEHRGFLKKIKKSKLKEETI